MEHSLETACVGCGDFAENHVYFLEACVLSEAPRTLTRTHARARDLVSVDAGASRCAPIATSSLTLAAALVILFRSAASTTAQGTPGCERCCSGEIGAASMALNRTS